MDWEGLREGRWQGQGGRRWGWKAGQGQTREGLLCRRVLKCCFLGNKESQMFEEGYHTTQRVCQHEKTGKRKGWAFTLLQNHLDNSWWGSGQIQETLQRKDPRATHEMWGCQPALWIGTASDKFVEPLYKVGYSFYLYFSPQISFSCFYFQLRGLLWGEGVCVSVVYFN